MQNHLYLYPNLVKVRKATCSQKALAEKLGISQQDISRYESGRVKAPINYILDLASVCGVSVDYILGIESDSRITMSSGDFEILTLYSKLSKENKIRLRERAETLLETQQHK